MSHDPTVAEYAVVVELLDRPRASSPLELYAALKDDAAPSDIDRAVLSLAEAGVIDDTDGGLRASTALQRLDALGFIAV